MQGLVRTGVRFCFSLLLVALIVPLCSCAGRARQRSGPELHPETGPEFQGQYLQSFEVSSFVPCGSTEKPGYGVGYWLNWDDSKSYDRYRAEISKQVDNAVVYLKFTGTISPPGQYGHLGVYTREVTVEKVLEVKLRGICP